MKSKIFRRLRTKASKIEKVKSKPFLAWPIIQDRVKNKTKATTIPKTISVIGFGGMYQTIEAIPSQPMRIIMKVVIGRL